MDGIAPSVDDGQCCVVIAIVTNERGKGHHLIRRRAFHDVDT
jgi:translation elongation factor P/translation initiation factor 5A